MTGGSAIGCRWELRSVSQERFSPATVCGHRRASVVSPLTRRLGLQRHRPPMPGGIRARMALLRCPVPPKSSRSCRSKSCFVGLVDSVLQRSVPSGRRRFRNVLGRFDIVRLQVPPVFQSKAPAPGIRSIHGVPLRRLLLRGAELQIPIVRIGRHGRFFPWRPPRQSRTARRRIARWPSPPSHRKPSQPRPKRQLIRLLRRRKRPAALSANFDFVIALSTLHTAQRYPRLPNAVQVGERTHTQLHRQTRRTRTSFRRPRKPRLRGNRLAAWQPCFEKVADLRVCTQRERKFLHRDRSHPPIACRTRYSRMPGQGFSSGDGR